MDKRKKAAALKYDEGYDSPIVTAAGMGVVADRIIKKAHENEVPIVYNEELANLLNSVDIGDSIPEELYEAVAKIIAYVMDIDKLIGRR